MSGDGDTLMACINALEGQYPGLKERLCDEAGELRRFVNVYVNGEDVRFLAGLKTALKAGYEVSIVPAVAGFLSSLSAFSTSSLPPLTKSCR